MKFYAPDDYTSFSCLAGACRHTCCAGWEIDIDQESLERYERLPSPLWDRIQANIDWVDGVASFHLTAEERCPFLNREGLCELILAQGADVLCQICRDHPRYRNFWTDRTEIGLGLCCEAAVQQLLTREAPFQFVLQEDDGDKEKADLRERSMLALRDRLFALIQDRSRPMENRLEQLEQLSGVDISSVQMSDWIEFLSRLEHLDERWLELLERASGIVDSVAEEEFSRISEIALEQLASAFLYRHYAGALQDERTAERIAFTALSVRLIAVLTLCGEPQLPLMDRLMDTVRMYSAEIEYSEENMEAVLSALEELAE